ncbi:acetyl-CoA carboxylase biotin carboxylase subunit [Pyxidicoccus fallax]|uniref:Acetyl-CoA carboxylase biotin carboxylase subunit n=1 Tax=Pyxidicoccus fallax TaxID=394095 RepID=A0A848LQG2_9BACT|nr:acetyl-CoA carboxylase biotin carboxylase subunit [Pyxidicoccus fallax]NMO19880.1 acetyl-CoA carboxylase biotin carboxylase subunit [Pyxidicoccus fallax]NPC80539.1 acetyl-CoA carboxylase biotin carboxylase subunit [Pyxidicoccus fallax]
MERFKKVLVANRGEIAVRVIRTCKKLGYRTVAVFSEADRAAPHVSAADEAVPIGPSPAKESYLVIDKLLAAAKASGADAIHPGYGFLSENADFARACRDAGLVFIGPGHEAITLMGNKRQAKLRMIAAGVPCIPGYEATNADDEVLAAEGARIGFPLMVKAAAGGGGRGMRLVREPGQLRAALQSARSEATNAFGSGELILEKAVIDARHVELQVFADEHGNVVHLGERDCSVQRRHQKIVEESPSPAVSPALRARMGEVAVAAAKAIGYRGAGTIEFLLAPSGEFYFMEMNTRLQVEHPVTEEITGLDLVEWQLRVAAGERLPLTQEQVSWKGHAIEVRLCAEDPANNYAPQAGRLLTWRLPAREGVRIDHGVREGQDIPPFYDSMQAKVIAYGPDRETARRRLVEALRDLTVFGVTTNKGLLLHVLGHPAFRSGEYDTGFIGKHADAETVEGLYQPDAKVRALAGAALFHSEALKLVREARLDASLVNWNTSYSGHPVPLKLVSRGKEARVIARSTGSERYEVEVEGETFDLAVLGMADGVLDFAAAGARGRARYLRDGDTLWLDLGDGAHSVTDVTYRPPSKSDGAGSGRLIAPMDGRILRVNAQPGAAVKPGDVLAVLEAMKMEFQVVADVAGTVEAVNITVGGQVSAKQLLVVLKPEGKAG